MPTYAVGQNVCDLVEWSTAEAQPQTARLGGFLVCDAVQLLAMLPNDFRVHQVHILQTEPVASPLLYNPTKIELYRSWKFGMATKEKLTKQQVCSSAAHLAAPMASLMQVYFTWPVMAALQFAMTFDSEDSKDIVLQPVAHIFRRIGDDHYPLWLKAAQITDKLQPVAAPVVDTEKEQLRLRLATLEANLGKLVNEAPDVVLKILGVGQLSQPHVK